MNFLENHKRLAAVRIAAAAFRFLAFAIPLLLMQVSLAWASPAAIPIWIYETPDGLFVAKMSAKAEQDDYDRVTTGPVVSQLYVHKISGRNVSKNPKLVTADTCARDRSELEPLTCLGAVSPFAGASYTFTSEYRVDESKGGNKLNFYSGRDDPKIKRKLLALAKVYAKTKEFGKSHGFFSIAALTCSSGCSNRSTPFFIARIQLLGD